MPSSLSPPLRGGVAARSTKSPAASLARADGVVINHQQFCLNFLTTPSAPKEAARYLIDVADTPPRRGGEKAHPAAYLSLLTGLRGDAAIQAEIIALRHQLTG